LFLFAFFTQDRTDLLRDCRHLVYPTLNYQWWKDSVMVVDG
jgi:hypothetical protein